MPSKLTLNKVVLSGSSFYVVTVLEWAFAAGPSREVHSKCSGVCDLFTK